MLHALGIKQYAVAGNSFGGGIALAYPDKVESLVLIDSEGIPNGEDGYDISLFSDEKPIFPSDPAYTRISWLEKIGSRFIGPPRYLFRHGSNNLQ